MSGVTFRNSGRGLQMRYRNLGLIVSAPNKVSAEETTVARYQFLAKRFPAADENWSLQSPERIRREPGRLWRGGQQLEVSCLQHDPRRAQCKSAVLIDVPPARPLIPPEGLNSRVPNHTSCDTTSPNRTDSQRLCWNPGRTREARAEKQGIDAFILEHRKCELGSRIT
jgi:hypothetical protein